MRSILCVGSVLSMLFVGCASAPDTTGSEPQSSSRGSDRTQASSSDRSSDNGSSSSSSSSASSSPSSSGGSVPSAHGCPKLAGHWAGDIDGTYKDLLNPANTQPVTGTVTVTLEGNGDKLTLSADSAIDILVKNVPPINRDVSLKKALTGTADCGRLAAVSGGDTGLIKIDVTAGCTFVDDKCSGTFTADSGGKNVASGTFNLARQL